MTTTGLSRTAAGDVVPTAQERATARLRALGGGRDRLIGWVAALGAGLLALFLRMWRLDTPHQFSFDETYYAKDAWSLLKHGYVREYADKADEAILAGETGGQWLEDPSMIVHPEVGKWLIALGEKAFGMEPFGWRIASAVVGALMVVVMVRLARRLTGSTALGLVAGLLLCFDGLHLVLSRLALLDIFLAFFLLCAVHCLVADRDASRARLARLVPERSGGQVTGGQVTGGWGPVRAMLWRPWLVAGGVCFGLAVGTKWTALFPMAAFGLLVWLWSAGARRSFGVRLPVLRSALVDGVPAFLQLVGVAFVVYVATWTGWLINAHEYEQALSDTQYTTYEGGEQWATATEPDAEGLGEVTQSLRSLASYHRDVFVFHTQFLDDSEHTYASSPWGWLLLNRPVGVDAQLDIQPGDQGCDAPTGSDCLRQVLLLGTPVLWWGGALALIFSAVVWVGQRDWRFGLCVVGTLSTWLPWVPNADRPIFLFYAIASLPFLVLALTLTMGRLVGSRPVGHDGPTPRRTAGVVAAGSFFMLVLVNFAWFWPIWTDELITHSEWIDRIWFKRWI
ncbi:dolichyl-phosphate-mannose--protein mannosyltransferase [Nocardioides pacificus]